MSPRKLTEQDKQEILILYREPEETTSTLAARYHVSSSTISRFLKNNLSEQEYEQLIKQKRQSRSSNRSAKKTTQPTPVAEVPTTEANLPQEPTITSSEPETSPLLPPKLAVASPILQKKKSPTQQSESFQDSEEEDDEIDEVNVITLEEMLGEELGDLDEDEDEDEDEDDWDLGDREKDSERDRPKNIEVTVLPLREANFPQTCYLVIDRSAELITRPLKDFADLGNIPLEEFQQETLPVFDNHRVAKRFSSHRSQRVIKVPDGKMLEKTRSYLEAKGITRLLLDGQVFSLTL